jgi:hypothetical protein
MIETTITSGDGEVMTIESPSTEAPPPSGGEGDSAGVGSVVEFTIIRGEQ